jgi:hypothetical protein
MKKKVSRAFKKMQQAKLSTFSNTIGMRMSEDVQFSSFKTDVDALKALNDALSIALSNAADGGKSLTVIKDRCLVAVIEKLDQLANDVERFADGDEVIIMAAGFEVRAAPVEIKEISTPTNLTVINAPRTGEIKACWENQYGVVNYGILYQLQGETEWKNGTYSTTREVILSGFVPGSIVNVKIYAMGRRGLKSDNTEPVSVMVI